MFLLRFGLLLTFALTARAEEGAWLRWLSRDLRAVEQQLRQTRDALAKLGVPVMSQTTAELGYQHPQLQEPPPASPWVQIDLGSPQDIDWVALVPALVDWQPGEQKLYGFPRRFRVDVSGDASFATFTPVAVFTEEDFPPPGLALAVFRTPGAHARYVRITVTKLAEENGTHFFTLSEVMVVQGSRNIAFGRKASASSSANLPPRWHIHNLTDGRSPLGPPIERELLPYDGLFADPLTPDQPAWMLLDLGADAAIDEVRLHPVHARLGADVPGFAFPQRFRVELSPDAAFTQPAILLDSTHGDYSNPGNNPVTIPVPHLTGRFLRILMFEHPIGAAQRFGLSEIEVFSGDKNLARSAAVTATPDRRDRPEQRPASLIVDGYTSYGRLLPLSTWFERWQSRRRLQDQISELETHRIRHDDLARRRAWLLAAGLSLLLPGIGLTFAFVERRKRARALRNLRNRLAQDLHDEIGSNIAGIAMISETAATQSGPLQKEDWQEVNRIARETTEAMREVLWLVGARTESGPDFVSLLQRTAQRLLTGLSIHWTSLPEHVPSTWPPESRRQVFLFFKEALTNIARHAHARQVHLALEFTGDELRFDIRDDGQGFNPRQKATGIGLASMKERAKSLHAHLTLDSQPAVGTHIRLVAPLPSAP